MNWFNRVANKTIDAADIYNIFALALIPPNRINPDEKKMMDFEASYLKEKFINVFVPLMRNQIQKYLGRDDRFDPSRINYLKRYPNAAPEDLEVMFNKDTFRSQRHRSQNPDDIYNVRWGKIANAVKRLSSATSYYDIVIALAGQNGLLNLIHNTETSVLDKLNNADELLLALDFCQSNQTDPHRLLNKANADIRSVASRYVGNII